MSVIVAVSVVSAGTIIGAITGVIVLVVAAYTLSRYLANLNHQAQLNAKDEVIKTNEQTIDSFHNRVRLLEADLQRVTDAAQAAEKKISELSARIDALTQYTAPEAVKRFEKLAQERHERIQASLHRIEQRLGEKDKTSGER